MILPHYNWEVCCAQEVQQCLCHWLFMGDCESCCHDYCSQIVAGLNMIFFACIVSKQNLCLVESKLASLIWQTTTQRHCGKKIGDVWIIRRTLCGSGFLLFPKYEFLVGQSEIESNLAIRNGLIRNKLVLRNHFLRPICHLLLKDKELLALRNNLGRPKSSLLPCLTVH